jgi:hypothetical protein
VYQQLKTSQAGLQGHSCRIQTACVQICARAQSSICPSSAQGQLECTAGMPPARHSPAATSRRRLNRASPTGSVQTGHTLQTGLAQEQYTPPLHFGLQVTADTVCSLDSLMVHRWRCWTQTPPHHYRGWVIGTTSNDILDVLLAFLPPHQSTIQHAYTTSTL